MVNARKDEGSRSIAGADDAHWLADHRSELLAHQGKWVAISGGAIVGVGKDAAEALDLATQRGASVPLLYFVADPAVKSRIRIA
ncbi:MAG: hypothetical protein HY873_00510 [Chloroflexi bacterium]|nr:hypothetical protein [Chloroflexota bacterium]